MCFSIIFSKQRYIEIRFVLFGPDAYSLGLGYVKAIPESPHRTTNRGHVGSTKVNLIANFSQLNLYNFSKGLTAPERKGQLSSGLRPAQPLTNTGVSQNVAESIIIALANTQTRHVKSVY
jgi:hypothetical protein